MVFIRFALYIQSVRKISSTFSSQLSLWWIFSPPKAWTYKKIEWKRRIQKGKNENIIRRQQLISFTPEPEFENAFSWRWTWKVKPKRNIIYIYLCMYVVAMLKCWYEYHFMASSPRAASQIIGEEEHRIYLQTVCVD